MIVTCRLIALTVGRVYEVDLNDLYSDRRDDPTCVARHMSWALARRLTRHSLPEIGRAMGGRDHSTVLYGIRKIESGIRIDPQMLSVYQTLVQTISDLAIRSDARPAPITFHQIDPIVAARQIIATPFGELAPTLDEVRSLALGVLHLEQELAQRLADDVKPNNGARYLVVRRTDDNDLKSAGRKVLSSWQRFSEATLSGFGTINARRSFGDALKTLKTILERS